MNAFTNRLASRRCGLGPSAVVVGDEPIDRRWTGGRLGFAEKPSHDSMVQSKSHGASTGTPRESRPGSAASSRWAFRTAGPPWRILRALLAAPLSRSEERRV